jgi:hypothetical protein
MPISGPGGLGRISRSLLLGSKLRIEDYYRCDCVWNSVARRDRLDIFASLKRERVRRGGVSLG